MRALLVLVLSGGLAAQTTTPLHDLLREAEQNSLAVIASAAAVKSSIYGPAQASALPDTEVMVQSLSVGDPRPGAGWRTNDFAYVGFGASQELPFPGKRELRRAAARREIDMARAESQMTLADVLLRVKLAYFGLARTQAVLALLERSRGIVDQMEQGAQIRYRTGGGAQQEVIRAQLERSRLGNEVAMQKREAAQLQAQLRALLNRPATSPDIIAEAIQPRSFAATMPAVDASPELQAQQAVVAKAQAEVDLARRERRPDFGVQYMWQHTSDQFRDYYMGTFSVRWPNRGRVKAAEDQAIAKREQAEAQHRAQHRQIQAELEQEWAALRTIEDQLRIYREGLLPQSQVAFESGLAGYRAGRQEYQGLLTSYSDSLRLAIEYQQLLTEHESTIARMERLTGGELK
jgi:outer membrane protein, heavy metal efflux system